MGLRRLDGRVVRRCGWLPLVALACLDPLAAPPGTYEFSPPASYHELWQAVEACSGRRGDFGRVRWYGVPRHDFQLGDQNVNGAWKWPHNIYLVERVIADSAGSYFTVRHEMLHDLVGKTGHPPVFTQCGL